MLLRTWQLLDNVPGHYQVPSTSPSERYVVGICGNWQEPSTYRISGYTGPLMLPIRRCRPFTAITDLDYDTILRRGRDNPINEYLFQPSSLGTLLVIVTLEMLTRLPLYTYRLSWAGEPSGWWDEWENTSLQTQDSNFAPWRSEAEHATSRSRRLPTILNLHEWAGKKHFVSLKLEGQSMVWTRDLRLPKQALSTACTRAPALTLGWTPAYITCFYANIESTAVTLIQRWCNQ